MQCCRSCVTADLARLQLVKPTSVGKSSLSALGLLYTFALHDKAGGHQRNLLHSGEINLSCLWG